MSEVPQFIIVNQSMVYDRIGRRLVRGDLLSDLDRENSGPATAEWLEANQSFPGREEALAFTGEEVVQEEGEPDPDPVLNPGGSEE